MKYKELSFRIVLRPEPEGGYTVIVPTLPGCITYGNTLEEAKKMAKDAIKAYLKSMRKHGEKIQDDSTTLEGMLTLKYA
jgi:predicted RNase H-like HicB family nuclease